MTNVCREEIKKKRWEGDYEEENTREENIKMTNESECVV